MNASREQVFSVLFSLLSGAAGFATTSRRLRLPSDVPAGQQPALFLSQGDEDADQASFGATRWRLSAHVAIYVNAGADPNVAPDTLLNPLVDAVEMALTPVPPGAKQTLGGLVDHCYIDGKVVRDPGVLDGQAFAVVPLTIVTGT